MSSAITAYLIIITSIGLGTVACYFCFGAKVVMKVAVGWCILITLAMFTHMLLVVAAGVAIAMSIREGSHELKILYFIALMPVLPLAPYIIPFPGINFLWDINFTRLLVLLLLFPMFMIYVNNISQEGAVLRLSDLFFLMFFLMNLLVQIRLGSPTNIFRAMFSILVDYGIPYFAISRFLITPMALNWLFSLFLIGACFLSFTSIFESVFGWRMYGEILKALNLKYDPVALVPYVRSGTVRASGGSFVQPLAYAFYASIAVVVTYFMWQQKQLKFIFAFGLMGIFFVGMMLTGSRGGLLSVMVGIMMLYYMRLSPNLKLFSNVLGGSLIVIMIIYFNAAGFSAIDSQGTFQYRVDLVKNSIDAISRNWLMGSGNSLNNASLQQSMQGEGIIDIVNMYISTALQMGVLGLFPFVMLFLVLIRDVSKKTGVVGTDHKNLIVAVLVMIMVFIGTCSPVSFLPWYLVVFFAIARAYTGFAEQHPQQNYRPQENLA